MATKYEDGRRFEWSVIADLQNDGYLTVRAAGSKGETKIDVVAFKSGQILLIQAKRNGRISPAERLALIHVAAMINVNQPVGSDLAIPIVARKTIGRAKPVYDRLTGTGPQDHVPFITDELAE